MRGDIAMHDAPCPDLHQENHLESSEPSGHHGKEIGRYDGLGVIVDKRPPVLRRGSSVTSSLRLGRPIEHDSRSCQTAERSRTSISRTAER
jgi:hypothetical protein